MLHLVIVGGASGVGKSTLLEAFASMPQLNTGTFFKKHMSLQSRDDVRAGDWSQFQEAVAQDLSVEAINAFNMNSTVVIDTHFAAKINNRLYRIGLKESLLSTIANSIFGYGDDSSSPVKVSVVLIRSGIHSLLRRRRLDKSRKREIVPSDCFNALRSNDMYSWHYYHQFLRESPISDFGVTYTLIENETFDEAQNALGKIIKGE